ncbi:hypothetical protein GobsT_52990 [Gemmata obscuriglobus]|uniref:DUF2171 domain-containing protein n=1 Tax=Gemmata obscuriglobus TaxID=114 RepID=A0A2Z3H139_9BACT|nr:DUF2171 domain-containing protein [Gemmata obscuriglobus]AWM36835.1 DUF2171 domain-containing protein [Gemmata obscuriglobus]QEG30494.1 hypothetical protein GobsT_52990 [Gemmata obscuriglobus]VTS09818.1 Uncultured bacterium genome assembly Metasoil_fosmids_resub OS=uncultured bacterium PE=4 SV=1: DUF2171 [Gemmata obscuriglobus UQM 2246]
MSHTTDKLKDAGQRIADNVAHAADWVKEKTGVGPGRAEGSDAGVAGIRAHMDVIASCGKKIGVVDHLDGNVIKLTKDSFGDDQHHYVPTSMVDHVDRHVHLNKNSEEAAQWCSTDASTCGLVG